MAEQRAPQAKLLSSQVKWLYRIAIVLALSVTGVAATGTWVLADPDRKHAISDTQFAEWVYAAVRFNQAIPGILLNGSLIVAVASFLQLRNDRIEREARLLPHKVLKGKELEKFLKDHKLDGRIKGPSKKEGKKSR